MKNTVKYALFGAALALIVPAYAETPDCYQVSTAVKTAVAAEPEKVLELVATHVAQNESCACEVVKAAIVASDADKELVAGIVKTAIEVAPDRFRIIGQCAVAVAPDALVEVQAVVTEYGAASGDSGVTGAKGGDSSSDSKGGDAKGGKEVVVAPPAPSANPLDFPGQGPAGPTPGGPGGFPLFPPVISHPPTVTPPSSTPEDVNTYGG